jgi:hypothetical protein
MVGTRRNRIVIDLNDKSAQRSTKTGRKGWSRALALIALVLAAFAILAAAGVFFWWQRYRTTPAYSLALIIDAAQRNDTATFDEMVETDKIVSNLTNQVTEKAAGRYGLALSPLAQQSIQSLVPNVLPLVKETVRDEVIKTVNDLSARFGQKPFFAVALTLPYVVKITDEGDNARVTLPDQPIELTLAKIQDRWHIVEVRDDAVVQRIVDRLVEKLPAIGQQLGLPTGLPPGSPRLSNRKRRR